MFSITSCPLPEGTIIYRYHNKSSCQAADTYTDCYLVEIDGRVTLAEYVFAFYTTSVFRLERFILKYLAGRPSSDREAKQLSEGTIDEFSAWTVEDRTTDQLLMCDLRGRTRSWFMIVPQSAAGRTTTSLYFGSAVVPYQKTATGEPRIGGGFRMLLGFHKLYSRVLLYSAKVRLKKTCKSVCRMY